MKITILGSGTSSGVPVVGCQCPVCASKDTLDRRLRSSALVETGSKRILIDCGPDFREQMLNVPYGRLHAVLLTHEHYDHVGGIDDLRPFCPFGTVNIYGDASCIQHISERMPYCFGSGKYPGAPSLMLHPIEPLQPLLLENVEILPFRIMHGTLPILGYRIGNFAYITDMKSCPKETEKVLDGLDCLIVNGLRHTEHPTHQTIEEAVRFVQKIGAKNAYLTHLAHTAGLHALSGEHLPDNIRFAFDGQRIVLE